MQSMHVALEANLDPRGAAACKASSRTGVESSWCHHQWWSLVDLDELCFLSALGSVVDRQ